MNIGYFKYDVPENSRLRIRHFMQSLLNLQFGKFANDIQRYKTVEGEKGQEISQ